jgi:hypothetical protein
MLRLLILSCLLSHSLASIVPLKTGSFDDQTYAKDGIVLLYDNLSETQLMYFINVASKFEDDPKINFWHINCDLADTFCKNRAELAGTNIPAMLYSFRNELWAAQGCKTYKEHAFETFIKTKLQENCLTVPRLCTYVMNETLKDFGDENHTVVRDEYLREKNNGDVIEHEWREITDRIQNDFKTKRIEFQNRLLNSDDKVKILGLLMEKHHSLSYEENEGELQEVVIDMRKEL